MQEVPVRSSRHQLRLKERLKWARPHLRGGECHSEKTIPDISWMRDWKNVDSSSPSWPLANKALWLEMVSFDERRHIYVFIFNVSPLHPAQCRLICPIQYLVDTRPNSFCVWNWYHTFEFQWYSLSCILLPFHRAMFFRKICSGWEKVSHQSIDTITLYDFEQELPRSKSLGLEHALTWPRQNFRSDRRQSEKTQYLSFFKKSIFLKDRSAFYLVWMMSTPNHNTVL
jgi:hypothetical protein